MTEDNNSPEVITEYYRIKHELIDLDKNLREAIANIRVRMTLGYTQTSMKLLFARAQKHILMILDLAISCCIIPVNEQTKSDIDKIKNIGFGKYKGISDFEFAQEFFRSHYINTHFYDVTVPKDYRPAVVKTFGRAR